MALAFESVYGTAPATGFRTVPFASTTLGSEQPLIASELLGQGRDPLTPIKDAVTADGDVVVPIDVENLGLWLKAAFGAPVTSGTTPKTHTFQSGNWTLPSLAIETAMPEVPRYAMYTGCVCDQLSWQMARSGLLTATARLVAQGESVAAATAAGTTTSLALQRFGHFNGAINNYFVAPVDGTYLFGATLLYKINASATARMRGRLVLNGATEIRGSFGEISATHVSLATAIWLQTMVPLVAGDTVELQGYFRVADGYFAADHTSFWGCKIG
jgi:hypothetical protein